MSYVSNCEMCTGQGPGSYSISSVDSLVSNYNGSSSYSSNSDYTPSALEYTVSNSEVACPRQESFNDFQFNSNYKQKKYFEGYLQNSKITQTYFSKSPFVLENIETKFIGGASEISDHIEDAFRNVTGEGFPDDILVHVCDKERLKEFHNEFGGIWSDGINGFAVNRKKSGLKSEVFVSSGSLSNVMATIGHEIGHCMSIPLDCIRDEEAKAFAFEFAWIKTIQENNIAGLTGCFNINEPAKNNVHNKAFDFVDSLLKKGVDAMDICFKLISGEFGGEL